MKKTNSSWSRIMYEVYYCNKICGFAVLGGFWGVIVISCCLSSTAFFGGYLYVCFSGVNKKINVDDMPLDPAKVARRIEYYQNGDIYKNSSYSEKLKIAESDARYEVKEEYERKEKEKEKKDFLLIGILECVIFLPIAFSLLMLFDVLEIRKYAKNEKLRAEDTIKNRVDTYRKKYVAKHKEEILKRTDEIKKNHDDLIINTEKREYFNRFVSREVYKMWDEEYLLWEMAYHAEIYEAYKKQEPKVKKTNREVMLAEFDEIKARVEMEKLTIEEIITRLNETEKEWYNEYGVEVAEEMVEQLKQRIHQYMSLKGL